MPKSLNWHLFHKSGALEFLNKASQIKHNSVLVSGPFKVATSKEETKNIAVTIHHH